jgi:transposase-like protein
MSTGKDRRNFTPKEKVAILRRYLVDKVPMSHVCEEYQIQSSVFYQWMAKFFENGAAAFEKPEKVSDVHQRRITELEKKLQKKNDVLAELMEEHVALKKSLGGN